MNYVFLFQFFVILLAYAFWRLVKTSTSNYGNIELELDKDYLFWAVEEAQSDTTTQEENKNV